MKRLRHLIAVACLWLAHKADPEWLATFIKSTLPEEVPAETPPQGGEVT